MKKRVVAFLILAIVCLPLALAVSVDSEIQKITSYAEDYETGNINYVQLLIYTSASRERMNEILGVTNKQMGGILQKEQLESVFGKPTEETKWVWVENEQHETKLDYSVPAWRKIIFDGKKIQIWMESWPSVFKKKNGEMMLFYRINFNNVFKKPQDELNINSKILEIQTLAQNFNSDPTQENADTLAKSCVNAERTFNSYFQQSPSKCEDVMTGIFGAENQRATQNLLVQKIDFYEGDNFEAIANLEMCDECEWNWINFNIWLEGRGPGFKQQKVENVEMYNKEQYKGKDSAFFKREIAKLLDEYKLKLSNKDFAGANSLMSKLNNLNQGWNEVSNNVWEIVRKDSEKNLVVVENGKDNVQRDPYFWIKEEQAKRQQEKDLRKVNYEERKQFYLNLFASYEKKEYTFTQVEYEKRLVEEFKESGKEICDNNQDDNKNDAIDCQDEQCGGKFCGKDIIAVEDGNQTTSKEVNLYCIASQCTVKPEGMIEARTICGNHKCEPGEKEQNCSQDCSDCPVYNAIECSGKVIFKGKDEKGCALEPMCLKETGFCNADETCSQPLCGKAVCESGKCKTVELEECKPEECSHGQEKVISCSSGEQIIAEKCIEGLWIKTEFSCPGGETGETTEKPVEEIIVGDACSVREDCGGENDVCSNGKCVTIPQVVKIEPTASTINQEETQQESTGTEPTTEAGEAAGGESQTTQPETEPIVTGEITRTIKTIVGFVISGFAEGEGTSDTTTATPTPDSTPATATQQPRTPDVSTKPEPGGTQPNQEQQPQPPIEGCPTIGKPPEMQENCYYTIINDEKGCPSRYEINCGESGGQQNQDEGFNNEPRDQQQDQKQNIERCKDDSKNRCNQVYVDPCINNCVFKPNTQEIGDLEGCKKTCQQEKKTELEECIKKCSEGCEQGKWCEMEQPQQGNKQEKGVFKAGGTCRNSPQKSEAFIFFDGWGEPFDQIQSLKQKYYVVGDDDWCKQDLENWIKQRKELESSFNQEFVEWYFEKYLANSAEEWEQQVSGIYELYWKDVDLSRQIANRMECLGQQGLPPDYNLINIKYETEYGKLEFWEEVKTTTKLSELGDKEVELISPYMKIWIFPPKSFIIYEMKQSMKNHEFPGPSEDKLEREKQEGPTEQEKQMIKQDEGFMNKIRKVTEKYEGNVDAVVQFKDYEKNEVVFNLYVQVNENDIIKMKPMPPEEVPEQDVKIEVDFEKVYALIYAQEKDMNGERLESPPWDQKSSPVQKVKEVVNGAKSYLKVRDIINSAKITPESSEKDVRSLFNLFFKNMMQGDNKNQEKSGESDNKNTEENIEEGVWDSKEKITGNYVLS